MEFRRSVPFKNRKQKSYLLYTRKKILNVFKYGHSVWIYKTKFSVFGTVPKSENLNSLGCNLGLNLHCSLEDSMEYS